MWALFNGLNIQAIFIAALGAVASVWTAYYLANLKVSAELRRQRMELTNTYSNQLLEVRLACYPEIWEIICDFERFLRKLDEYYKIRKSEYEETKNVFRKINHWDNKYGFIISDETAAAPGSFRKKLHSILN